MTVVGEGLWVGLDVGTQGTKGIVLDAASATIVARASQSYGLIEGLPAGAAEQHPETWIDAVRHVCSELVMQVDASRVAGLGISGQQHGFVPLDDDGAVIRPAKLWCDTATSVEAEELSRMYGRSVPTGFTASKILWLKRHEPENWSRLRTILLPHDYVNFRLTDTFTMEAGDASGTGFFDSASRMFDLHEVSAIDPRACDMLPELVGAGEPAGRLSSEGAALVGLPEGTLVSAGGGDNMMSAIGSGATRPGVVVVSLGTSGTVFCHASKPVVDPEGLIAPFCDSTGGWLPLLCVMNLTGVTEEVRNAFLPHVDDAHEQLTGAAEAVPPGCDGLLWLPYLQGERVPDLPSATGTLLGMRPGLLTGGHLFRAALEGTSLNLAWGVERMRDLGISVDGVRLVGGAARNPLWRSVLSACLDAPVTVLEEPESGALGGALQALWTARRDAGEDVGIDDLAAPLVATEGDPVSPDRELVGVYRDLLVRFREDVERLF
jgi:xylulokinase